MSARGSSRPCRATILRVPLSEATRPIHAPRGSELVADLAQGRAAAHRLENHWHKRIGTTRSHTKSTKSAADLLRVPPGSRFRKSSALARLEGREVRRPNTWRR